MRILFLGDIVGRPGRRVVQELLPDLRKEFSPEVVVANAENAAGGFGLTSKVVDELKKLGIAALTSGNHIWDKKEVFPLLDGEFPLLRPHNYPPGNPGRGVWRLPLAEGRALWVINLQGRVLMPPIDCPFRCSDGILDSIPPGERCMLLDFHAEATSEKRALGFYLDGRVSAVIGTHTHVPTADEEVLPKGTGYLTDAGMSGAYASVIGMEYQDSLDRLLLCTPRILNVASGKSMVSGVFLEIEEPTGKCVDIRRVLRRT